MMHSHEQYLNLDLSEIEFLSEETKKLLNSYNIYTLDQLLNATVGFSNVALFNQLFDGENLLQNFLEFIPAELIEKYSTYNQQYPTGLLKSEKDEKDN